MFLQGFRLQVMAIPLQATGVNSTPHLARVTLANFSSRVAQYCTVCDISKKSHPRRRNSGRTRNDPGLTAYPFFQHSVSTLSSDQEYPLQSATRSSVRSSCQKEPDYRNRNLDSRHGSISNDADAHVHYHMESKNGNTTKCIVTGSGLHRSDARHAQLGNSLSGVMDLKVNSWLEFHGTALCPGPKGENSPHNYCDTSQLRLR